MELEFDKEMDAILRKTRGGLAAPATTSVHIDADAIAAFAENALPDKTRLLYTAHLADCGRCRKLLVQAIAFNTGTVAASDEAASNISAPVEASGSWLGNLFRTPNLAVAMGALVLVFSGVLGYFVLQDRSAGSNTTVSQVTDQEPAFGGPFVGGDSQDSNSTAANANASAANTSANSAPANNMPVISNSAANAVSRTDSLKESYKVEDEPQPEEAKPVARQPASSTLTIDGVVTGGRETKEAEKKDADTKLAGVTDLETAKRKAIDDRARSNRDLPAPATKSGPVRSGPVQTQNNQINTNVFDMAVTRIVGGKTFNNRDGVWYDSAYRGQATTNVRRGSDEFKKLDGGLRSVANTLAGTVVVVWKNKAYRIQ